MPRYLILLVCLFVFLSKPAGRADTACDASLPSAKALIDQLQRCDPRIACTEPAANLDGSTGELRLSRTWDGALCRAALTNTGSISHRISEIVLIDIQHGLVGDTPVYGEGFTMLSQTGGTLGKPVDLGSYTDRGHYRIPEPEHLRTAYGMLELQIAPDSYVLLGFTSCQRFVGRFSFDGHRLRISYDAENLTIAPGETWQLEPLLVITGRNQAELRQRLTEEIGKNHPPVFHKPVPAGWCSWLCFGPGTTAKNILDNLDWIAAHRPELRYIQIDDGYQPWMGDWLETGRAFGGNLQDVLKQIKSRGFEPAIWVAPFVASPRSKLFHDHPDWFVKDDQGQPLRSDQVTFGGWRQGPWYVLDGTHPQVQEFLEKLFRTMHTQWGCSYFKLDGIFWGAIHGGHFFDTRATRVQAYRNGMEAIRRGAGDSFILGCNHPLWPSLGLIDGSRSSDDTSHSWNRIRSVAHENLLRAWQNGRLWWNDPDCLVLIDTPSHAQADPAGIVRKVDTLSENQFLFEASAILASGGLVLSGDDLPHVNANRVFILDKLIHPTGVAAQFENSSLETGRIKLTDRELICMFNWTDHPEPRVVMLTKKSHLTDFWSGADLGTHEGAYSANLPGQSARVICCQ